ncbi:ATP-binding cassette domain-containing protein [candidate division FCPU426 bacterium]|nr:ATP-binding cassette domain-containing protein [candidate division FCPU426 bacterium]
MIEVRNLTKVFKAGSCKAVDSVSFIVPKGQVVCLLGENGAGKTTTLRMLATMLRPTQGTAVMDGIDLCLHPAQVRGRIGTLFGGETGLYDRLSARENIRYFSDLNQIPAAVANERLERLIRMLAMEDYIDKRAGTFSKGMKQKTAIARSIIHNPSIMLLDEPTAGLDIASSEIIWAFLQDCKSENKTILFSSHHTEEIEKLGDRLVIIHRGRLLEDGTVSDIKARHGGNIKSIFLRVTGDGQ